MQEENLTADELLNQINEATELIRKTETIRDQCARTLITKLKNLLDGYSTIHTQAKKRHVRSYDITKTKGESSARRQATHFADILKTVSRMDPISATLCTARRIDDNSIIELTIIDEFAGETDTISVKVPEKMLDADKDTFDDAINKLLDNAEEEDEAEAEHRRVERKEKLEDLKRKQQEFHENIAKSLRLKK